jgi:hypothetical protein
VYDKPKRVFVAGTRNKPLRVLCYNHHKLTASGGAFHGSDGTCIHDYADGFLTTSYIVKKRAFDRSMFVPYTELMRLNKERK